MQAAGSAPVPLVEIWRSGRLESVHYGSVAVCDTKGRVVFARGQVEQPTFMRSSAKPFQALASLHLGTAERWQLTDDEVALMCSSHGGQPVHIRTAENILRKCGQTSAALQCGPHPPYHEPAAEAMYRAGQKPDKVHNNCSGKHAGMVATCRHREWPVETYHRSDHPLQAAIATTMAAFAGLKEPLATGVDGCGVPTFYVDLPAMATAYARLANSGTRPDGFEPHADRVQAAMCNHPVLVAAEGNFNTIMLEMLGKHLVAKTGAEGVYTTGLTGRGLGMAVKILDGNARAVAPVMVRLLEQFLHEVSVADFRKAVWKPITNTRKEEVGEYRVVNL